MVFNSPIKRDLPGSWSLIGILPSQWDTEGLREIEHVTKSMF
jgi:hypothetical protein